MVSSAASIHQFSNDLADLVARVRPALVFLQRTRVPVTGTVWSDGRVLTAAHALGGRDEGTVLLDDGSEAAAKVLGRDPTTDVALLEVEGVSLGDLVWATDVAPRPGELMLTIGREGPRVRSTMGMVMDVGPGWRTRAGGTIDQLVDVDASLPMGSSGGPLVGVDGRLWGMNTHGLRRAGGTVPATTLARVVEHLEAHGSVKPGYLGVGVQPVDLPGEEGGAVLVNGVETDSPAAKVLHVGDVIVEIDGHRVLGVRSLFGMLASLGGKTVTIAVNRGGERVEAQVELGVREGGPGRHRRGRWRR